MPPYQMPYSDKTRLLINDSPKTLGNILGRWAVAKDLSVTRISRATGATRQTVYNWFAGGDVAPAYRSRVETLISVLSTSNTGDDAWRNVCTTFDIRG